MTVRYNITLGASTTAGGKVTTAPGFFTIQGVPVAYGDDAVSCPACSTIGVIEPDGPRLGDTFNGKQVALSGDLCICQCDPPPRLVENQTFSYQRIDGDWLAGQASAAAAATLNGAGSAAAARLEGIPLVLLDPASDAPYRHRAYRLELECGVIDGTTDGDGATRPLTAQEHAAFIRWFVDDGSAPA